MSSASNPQSLARELVLTTEKLKFAEEEVERLTRELHGERFALGKVAEIARRPERLVKPERWSAVTEATREYLRYFNLPWYRRVFVRKPKGRVA